MNNNFGSYYMLTTAFQRCLRERTCLLWINKQTLSKHTQDVYIGCLSSGFGKISGHKTGWIVWKNLQESQNRVKLGHLMLPYARKLENCCFQTITCAVSPSFTRNTKISSLLELTVKKNHVGSANFPEEQQPMVPDQRTKYARHLPYNIWTVKSHVTWEPYNIILHMRFTVFSNRGCAKINPRENSVN